MFLLNKIYLIFPVISRLCSDTHFQAVTKAVLAEQALAVIFFFINGTNLMNSCVARA